MGVAIPKDQAYTECPYAHYVIVWDPLSDPPIVPVRSPTLTAWANKQKCARAPESTDRPGGRWAAWRAPNRQEKSKP